jgi:hypothetical protein
MKFYKILFKPVAKYANEAWIWGDSNKRKIQAEQMRTLKTITSLDQM